MEEKGCGCGPGMAMDMMQKMGEGRGEITKDEFEQMKKDIQS